VREFLWLDLESREAAAQMAIDLAMVEVARQERCTMLRLYRWQASTISLGANESALVHWRRDLIESDGVPCVRRPTGGRAVWHDTDDLTYSWAGRCEDRAAVRRTYRELHLRLAAAIDPQGRHTALSETALIPGLAAGACFDVPVGGEVISHGRKAIGSAQRVMGDHLLQHGAIAIRDRGGQLARYRRSQVAAGPAATGQLAEATVTAAAIAAAWRRSGAIDIPPDLVSRIVLASEPEVPRFQSAEWAWRR